MLEHYQRHMPKLTDIMLTIQNDLLSEFIDKEVVSFSNRF